MKLLDQDQENVLLVALDRSMPEDNIEESIKELEDLTYVAGGNVKVSLIQKRPSPDPSTYIGRGKAREIKNAVKELDIDTCIFNDELSGSQLKNLSDIIGVKIIDRTNLILDIFAQRATSNEGKLQVKLAQLKYRLPRLVGLGKEMSRTGGGIGTRGPGEQQLESDRRHIEREIKNIESKLDKVSKNRQTVRKRRLDNQIPIIALTGYTNSGKSSLMNKIIETSDHPGKDRNVYVEDMLFATLGTSLRRAQFSNGQDFLLIDTVGFVSRLPTYLVEAFKSTLEEIKYSDLIIHVVDSVNIKEDLQIQTTNQILAELGVLDKPIIYAFNKLDLLDQPPISLKNKYQPSIFLSAKTGENVDLLLDMVYENLGQEKMNVDLFFNYNDQDILNYFINKYELRDLNYTEKGVFAKGKISEKDYNKYSENVIKNV